ncbi:MAG: nicotinate-nicotinamide nucleotide adenylyltransferase [bacterium]
MLLVYGGSFNPITKAHYEIAKLLKEKYNSNFLFVPVGNSYSKENLIEFHHRFNMLNIIANKLDATVINAEDNKKYLGTYDLLKKLQKEDKDIYFILGADNLINLHNWINAKKLIEEFKFIVLTRDNIKLDFSSFEYPNNFDVVNINFDISSSDFRNNKNTNVIDEDVLKYIKENNLYEV